MKPAPLKTILVDDEQQAVKLLEEMAWTIPGISVMATYTDPVKALLEIRDLRPDLVFLDVQMPRMSGFELLRGIRNAGLQPSVIFITAYDQYAMEAIHQEAFDYLMKPVSPQELSDSVSRLIARQESRESLPAIDRLLSGISVPKLRFADRNGIYFFAPDEILYVEAEGNYSKMYLKTRQHMVTRKIGEMVEILVQHGFMRISRSYIINPVYLSRIDRKRCVCFLEQGDQVTELPVAEERLRGL
jgi:two-component system LytT family response regulator